ncbi:hypothetical protein GQ43DRAFT_367633, partial [Delitschia confertaspora ATCC 74209]
TAGIPVNELACSDTSAYSGTSNPDYREIQKTRFRNPPIVPLLGADGASLSNCTSHFYALRG